MKQEVGEYENEEYPFEESDEEEETVQKKPKSNKPGFTTKLKSAFGGLFKKKKKNTDQQAQVDPKASKSNPPPKEIPQEPKSKQNTSQSKVLTSKKTSKENEKVSEQEAEIKLKPQTGDEEIYTFYFDGPPKYRFRVGFHQFNGHLEDENKENPVEFIVTDMNRNGHSHTTNKAQKNTNIDSQFFNFETS